MTENSILAVDFGNVHTRALLIDLVEGVYQLVAQAEERTTGTFPISDVGVGFRRVLQQLTNNTGRLFLQRNGVLITPEQPDRSGIDAFIATASIGRPLRTVLIGLMPDMSIVSAQRAAAGTYVDIVDVISLGDTRSAQDQLNAIIMARPDLIFITGGTENGAREPVLERARLARLALHLMQSGASVLYAGNSALVPQINDIFENVATVFIADNVRPTLDSEAIETAQAQLATAFDSFTKQRGIGFDEIGVMSRVGVLPTAQSYHTIVSYLSKTAKSGVLAVDVGSAASTLSASVKEHTATTIRTDIGLGHSAHSLIDAVGMDAVRAWLPFCASDNDIQTYTLNKSLRPATIPEDERSLYFEHALLRAALSGLLRAGRPTWTPTQAFDDLDAPLPPFERVIAAGAGLTGTGRPTLTAMLLLDALQPVGIVNLQTDANAIVAALGALARVNPEAVVQVLDAGGVENLCTCLNVSGSPRKGRAAVRVRVTPAQGPSEKFTVRGGELWVYPLSVGLHATVRISMSGRGLHIGGKRRFKLELEGGTAGLIIDARGRPLPLAKNVKALAEQIPEWYAQATGDPVFQIPTEWLSPPEVEAEIPTGVDRHKAQSERVLSVLGDEDEEPPPKSRGRLFGRRAKDQDGEAESEEDESDLRNLLS